MYNLFDVCVCLYIGFVIRETWGTTRAVRLWTHQRAARARKILIKSHLVCVRLDRRLCVGFTARNKIVCVAFARTERRTCTQTYLCCRWQARAEKRNCMAINALNRVQQACMYMWMRAYLSIMCSVWRNIVYVIECCQKISDILMLCRRCDIDMINVLYWGILINEHKRILFITI